MTGNRQSIFEDSRIEWPAWRNHLSCVAHVIQLASGAFMSSLGVKCRTKSWVAHQCIQQFGENESIDIGKSQRLRKEGNAGTSKVSALRPGQAKIIQKGHISWYFESPETGLNIAENACCINYAYTWSPKRVHWLSKSQSMQCGTSDYGCEDTLELHTGVARARLPFIGIHMWVALNSKIQWIPATLHNSGWMDDCLVCRWSIEAISILDPMDVAEAYSHIESRYHRVQWHVRSHGWPDASFAQEKDSIEQRLVLRCEVTSTEDVQILRWSDSDNRHASHFYTYSLFFPEVAII